MQQVGGDLLLLGYDLEGQEPREAGAPLKLNLYWQPAEPAPAWPEGHPPADLLSLTMQSPAGSSYELWQGPVTPATAASGASADWRPGEVFCRRIETHIPADAPAGEYELRMGLGEPGQEVTLGALQLATSARQFEAPPVERPVDTDLGDWVRLVGADVTSALEPGRPYTVTLIWQALQPATASYQVFVHLVDQGGRIVAQSDAFPSVAAPLPAGELAPYPTDRWAPGEVVTDVHVLQLPSDMASGDAQGGQAYQLYAGMYDPLSGQRLPARDRNGQAIPQDAIPLGEPDGKRP